MLHICDIVFLIYIHSIYIKTFLYAIFSGSSPVPCSILVGLYAKRIFSDLFFFFFAYFRRFFYTDCTVFRHPFVVFCYKICDITAIYSLFFAPLLVKNHLTNQYKRLLFCRFYALETHHERRGQPRILYND